MLSSGIPARSLAPSKTSNSTPQSISSLITRCSTPSSITRASIYA